MRELTEAEQELVEVKSTEYFSGSVFDSVHYGIFADAFITGLEAQEARIAELEARIAELESDIKIAEMYKRYSEIEI